MWGRPRQVLFRPYGRRRSRGRLPRWLVLVLGGALLGAASVVLVQWRYLAPRLSATESAALRADFEQADAQRQRLKAELAEATKRLDAALGGSKTLNDGLAASRSATERLREDVAAAVAALPPDPRGGEVGVRAARLGASAGALGYEIVLTRERNAGRPLNAALQLVVAGASARGPQATITSEPVAVAIAGHAIVRGSVALPAGFRPHQATIQVLERAGGKPIGMRVMLVK